MKDELHNTFMKPHMSFQIGKNLKIEIETQRLSIRSYCDDDFDNCVALYGEKRITKYFDHGRPQTSREVKDMILERGTVHFNNLKPFGLFSIFLKQDMTFIGQIDFFPTDETGTVEIGFILL